MFAKTITKLKLVNTAKVAIAPITTEPINNVAAKLVSTVTVNVNNNAATGFVLLSAFAGTLITIIQTIKSIVGIVVVVIVVVIVLCWKFVTLAVTPSRMNLGEQTS